MNVITQTCTLSHFQTHTKKKKLIQSQTTQTTNEACTVLGLLSTNTSLTPYWHNCLATVTQTAIFGWSVNNCYSPLAIPAGDQPRRNLFNLNPSVRPHWWSPAVQLHSSQSVTDYACQPPSCSLKSWPLATAQRTCWRNQRSMVDYLFKINSGATCACLYHCGALTQLIVRAAAAAPTWLKLHVAIIIDFSFT